MINIRKFNAELKKYINCGLLTKVEDIYHTDLSHEFSSDVGNSKQFSQEEIDIAYNWVMKNKELFLEFWNYNDTDSLDVFIKANVLYRLG